MCHANLGLDSPGTRFRRWLEHCSIPSQKVACMWLKMMIKSLFLFSLPLATIPAVIIAAASANSSFTSLLDMLIFGARNFHSWRIGYEKAAPEHGVDLWRQCLARVPWMKELRLHQSKCEAILYIGYPSLVPSFPSRLKVHLPSAYSSEWRQEMIDGMRDYGQMPDQVFIEDDIVIYTRKRRKGWAKKRKPDYCCSSFV